MVEVEERHRSIDQSISFHDVGNGGIRESHAPKVGRNRSDPGLHQLQEESILPLHQARTSRYVRLFLRALCNYSYL